MTHIRIQTLSAAVLVGVLTLSAAAPASADTGSAPTSPGAAKVISDIDDIVSGMSDLESATNKVTNLISALAVQSTATKLSRTIEDSTTDAREAGKLDQASSDALVRQATTLVAQTTTTTQALKAKEPEFRRLGLDPTMEDSIARLARETMRLDDTLGSEVTNDDKAAIQAASRSIDTDFQSALSTF
ncbi:cell wall mannoprotein 1 family protein [Kitasatospora sp. NPDC089797]|uniref:cell wall mannoprotein 1 family protein n=1 Tax=Kitasatospora sp. NPDC089797 TaxID=3155298 RepID=UPI0034496B72